MSLHIVILAAGRGTRMHSPFPKVLHPLAGRPLLAHVIQTAQELAPDVMHIVLGYGADQIQQYFTNHDDLFRTHAGKKPELNWVMQAEQLGTGHAVAQALPYIPDNSRILVLYGDVPLITATSLLSMLQQTSIDEVAVLTARLSDPQGYGRIVRDSASNTIIAIIEQRDATPEQCAIDEINSGIMLVPKRALTQWLQQITNDNAQGEYYLTDIIKLAVNDSVAIRGITLSDVSDIQGVNNREQLAQVERSYQLRVAQRLMNQGVTLFDPHRFDVRGELEVGQEVTIDINTIFEGHVVLGNNVTIGPNCLLSNVKVEDHSIIKANSVLEDCTVGRECTVGPFARLRPGTLLKAHAKVGNFVEIKKATIGENSKVSHLSYIGDATIGKDVNVGAGTITCNYDGYSKFQTVIEDGAFIGSDTQLVAPVVIGRNANIAAGSTVRKDAPAEQLTVTTRLQQRTVPGWKRPQKDEEI
ncbi:MAG: bifunctional UDP-N-acetylglucosamine diphosphorylase/glucosamine-1-phosphate N-acetyltransferase GlmU [Gammaproteobacteria bacterium]